MKNIINTGVINVSRNVQPVGRLDLDANRRPHNKAQVVAVDFATVMKERMDKRR